MVFFSGRAQLPCSSTDCHVICIDDANTHAAACVTAVLAAASDAAREPCTFGYGCASMNFTVGRITGNAWAERGIGGYEEYLMIPYASARRFEKPTVTSAFSGGSFDATNILGDGSAACVQPGQ